MDVDKQEIDSSGEGLMLYVKDISNASATKYQHVENLKYDYEKVQNEVKMKMEELKQIKESNANLKDYLNSHKFMMDELQKTEESDVDEINVNQDAVKNLRQEMAKMRLSKNEDLTTYEEKVVNITNMLTNGPFTFNQNMLSDKMKKLLEIQADVKKELVNISTDLETIRKKFNLEQAPVADKLATQLETFKNTTEENSKLTVETAKLETELKSLTKLSMGLENELANFKKQHKVD